MPHGGFRNREQDSESLLCKSPAMAKYISHNIASLRFEVEDDGIGIDDDMKGRLFQPFAQAQKR